jgi:m7GpppX diphosphatase
MSHPATPKSFETLRRFKFERVLNEDPLTHFLVFLGSLPVPGSDDNVQAIIRLEKTALDPSQIPSIFHSLSGIERVEIEQSTDIVRALNF